MKVSQVAVVAMAGMAISSTALAQWTGASITDGDVRLQIQSGSTGAGTMPTSNTAGGSGVTADFRTTGAAGTDNAFTDWWWFRSGTDTREFAISSPTGSATPTKTLTGTNQVDWTGIQPITTGVNADLRFDLQFRVQDLDGAGGSAGQTVAVLTARNVGTSTITAVTVQHYFDYFISGQDANDICDGIVVGSGYRAMFMRDTVTGLQMTHIGIGATGMGVGSFSLVGSQVGDTTVDNFADVNGATTAGDQSGIMQFDLGDIAPGSSASATAIIVIPAPGTAALLGIGGLVAGRRRRN